MSNAGTRRVSGQRRPKRSSMDRPRYEIGANVYCSVHGLLSAGRVVAHHAPVSLEGFMHRQPALPEDPDLVHPYQYQIELMDGRTIFVNDDADAGVHRVPRYQVGADVHCNIGNGKWAAGRVVAHSHLEPSSDGSPARRRLYPYQVKLHAGRLIYIPRDNDQLIMDEAPTIAADHGEHALSCTAGLASLAFEFDDEFEVTSHELSPRNAQNCTLHLQWTESEARYARHSRSWACSTSRPTATRDRCPERAS